MGLLVVAVTGPVLVIDRSAEATIVVVADAVLLAVFGSGSLPLTVAVLVMVPAVAGAVALMVIVALAPKSTFLTAKDKIPADCVLALLGQAGEPEATPPGSAPATVTPVAAGGA